MKNLDASNDEGYTSINEERKKESGKSSIQSALEVLCSRRNDFYDGGTVATGSSTKDGATPRRGLADSLLEGGVGGDADSNVRSWEEIFSTVEKFSHNTLTLLSWIEEFKDIQDIKFDSTRGNRTEVTRWSDDVIKHVDRIYSQVKSDGKKLMRDFQSEREVVETIMKNVKKEYREVAPGWCAPRSRDPSPQQAIVKEEENAAEEREEIKNSSQVDFEPPLSSTLAYNDDLLDIKDRSDYVSKDAHRVRLWWKLVTERENCLSLMNNIQRKLDIATCYYPKHTLRTHYIQYLTEVRDQEACTEPLKSLADIISELYPELRYKAKTLVYDTEQAYLELETNARSRLIDLEPQPPQVIPHAKHVYRPYSPSYQRRDADHSYYSPPYSSRNQLDCSMSSSPSRKLWSTPNKDDLPMFEPLDTDELCAGEHQLSDFSFQQIRDKLALSENESKPEQKENSKSSTHSQNEEETEKQAEKEIEDTKDISENPVMIAEEALRLHSWMKINEGEAVEVFSTKPIGWDPDLLRTFLSKNKLMQEELLKQAVALDEFERSAVNYLHQSSSASKCDARQVKIIDDVNLHWALLMLKQRHSTLSLFCLDVQCLLERRLDVIHVLEKKVAVSNLKHPMENIWTELAVEIKPDEKSTDRDYDLIKGDDDQVESKESSVKSSSSA